MFILLEGVNQQSLAFTLEGVNQMDINQTIPMADEGGRDLHIVTPDIVYNRHLRHQLQAVQRLGQGSDSIFHVSPEIVSHTKQTLAKKRASISLSSAKIRMARAIVPALFPDAFMRIAFM